MSIQQINSVLIGNAATAIGPGGSKPAQRGENAPTEKIAPGNDKQRLQDSKPPALEDVKNAVKKVQDFVQPASSDIQFSFDKDTDSTVVKIIDRSTKEVIRQIPTQEILDIARSLDRLQGLLVKNQA